MTQPRTRRCGSRSRSRITRRRASSTSRCGSSTAASSPTAAARSSSPRAERARDLQAAPALIAGVGQVHSAEIIQPLRRRPRRRQRGRRAGLPHGRAAAPQDIDVAQLYDAFTPRVVHDLVAYGFTDWDERAASWSRAASSTLGGKLPCNTAGGLLSEGHLSGMNHVAEAVRQVRGTSCNQVRGRRAVAGDGLRRRAARAAADRRVHRGDPEASLMFQIDKPLPAHHRGRRAVLGGLPRRAPQRAALHRLRASPLAAEHPLPEVSRRGARMDGALGQGDDLLVHRRPPATAPCVLRRRALQRRHRRAGGGASRLHSNIVDCANEDLRIGMPVEVMFEKIDDEVTLPKFRPCQ